MHFTKKKFLIECEKSYEYGIGLKPELKTLDLLNSPSNDLFSLHSKTPFKPLLRIPSRHYSSISPIVFTQLSI